MDRRTFAQSAAAVFAAASAAPATAQTGGRAVVEAFYLEVLNGLAVGDLPARAERVLADDWRSIGDYSGRDKTRAEFVAQLGGFAKIIPDLKWEIVEILEAGGRFVVRGRARGTPAAPFFGVEPAGKSFDIMSIDIHTLTGGKIMRSYHIEDWASALRQLRAA
jgi:predicted ester cyclase